MIKNDNKSIASIYSGEKVIEKIYKGTLKVYEGWRNLFVSGVPPLTLTKCKGKGKSKLPSEYQEVEYIESTGTQWIDTGYIPKANTTVIFEYGSVGVVDLDNMWFGHKGGNGTNFWLENYTETIFYSLGSLIYQNIGQVVQNGILKFSKNGIFINDIKKSDDIITQGELSTNLSCYLFARNNQNTADYPSAIQCKSFRCYEDDKIVLDLVPCYRKEDNVIGLYDTVTNTFYTNQGTGTFLKGESLHIGVDLVDYKIFGNSKQGENMVTYPYVSPNGFSSNGVTFTINSDKSITANGTATADAYFQIGRITLEANKSYILYKAPKGASSTTYSLLLNGVKRVAENDEYVTLTEEKTGIFYVLIQKGNTVDNLTFYPRIVEGPTPDAPLEVESVGDKSKNYFNINAIDRGYGDVTYNVSDNILDMVATGTKGAQFVSKVIEGFDANEEYIFSYKGKKISNTGAANTSLMIIVYGSNNGVDYTMLKMITQSNPVPNQEYSFSYSVTGYSYYRFYIYNHGDAIITIGEHNQYYDMQFERGNVVTNYEPYGYKIPVKASRDLNYLTYLQGYRIGDDNQISPSAGLKCTNEYIDILPNTKNQLFLDGTIETNYYLSIPCYDKDKNFITRLTNYWAIDTEPKIIEFTTPDNCYFIKLNIPNKDYDVRLNPITTNIYLNEPLRKIGDYADYIDFTKQKIFRNVEKLVANGTELWYSSLENGKRRVFLNGRSSVKENIVLSDKYVKDTVNYAYPDINKIMVNVAGSLIIGVDNTVFPDLETYKTWLKTNNVTIYLPLKTPKEELIELPNIPTHKGTTILEVDTEIQPSNMEVIYKGKN